MRRWNRLQLKELHDVKAKNQHLVIRPAAEPRALFDGLGITPDSGITAVYRHMPGLS